MSLKESSKKLQWFWNDTLKYYPQQYKYIIKLANEYNEKYGVPTRINIFNFYFKKGAFYEIIGFFFVFGLIWLRFIRERLPRNIPVLLTEGYFLVIVIIIVFTFI